MGYQYPIKKDMIQFNYQAFWFDVVTYLDDWFTENEIEYALEFGSDGVMFLLFNNAADLLHFRMIWEPKLA